MDEFHPRGVQFLRGQAAAAGFNHAAAGINAGAADFGKPAQQFGHEMPVPRPDNQGAARRGQGFEKSGPAALELGAGESHSIQR